MTRILASTLTALTASLALLLGGCASLAPTSAPPPPQPQPPSPPIVAVDAWGGQSLAVPAPELTHRIRRITVHHQGEVWPAAQRPDDTPTAYLQRLQSWSRLSKRWTDIPYHYVIAPDGRIYATRDPAARGDTNTEYDPSGHALVMLMGNFEVQEPTAAQLGAATELLVWLARQHGLTADAIASHRDFSQQTVCPGRALYAQLPSLREAVRKRLH